MVFILFIVFLLIVGVGAYFLIKLVLNKNFNVVEDTSTIDNIEETHQFLPFKNVADSMIDLGDFQFRAIIECNSINFNLRTDSEQDMIEASYQTFLSGLKEPVTFYIQTREIDNSKVIESLRAKMEQSIKIFPNLETYAQIHLNDMMQLSQTMGNNKQKHKYIIVSYNNAALLDNLTDNEKYDLAAKELYSQCQIIIDSLANCGLRAKVSSTLDLYELIYTAYHKDGMADVENLLTGEFLASIVSGPETLHEMSAPGQLDWILHETEMKLQTKLSENALVSDYYKARANEAIAQIEKIRDELAGYYKD